MMMFSGGHDGHHHLHLLQTFKLLGLAHFSFLPSSFFLPSFFSPRL